MPGKSQEAKGWEVTYFQTRSQSEARRGGSRAGPAKTFPGCKGSSFLAMTSQPSQEGPSSAKLTEPPKGCQHLQRDKRNRQTVRQERGGQLLSKGERELKTHRTRVGSCTQEDNSPMWKHQRTKMALKLTPSSSWPAPGLWLWQITTSHLHTQKGSCQGREEWAGDLGRACVYSLTVTTMRSLPQSLSPPLEQPHGLGDEV